MEAGRWPCKLEFYPICDGNQLHHSNLGHFLLVRGYWRCGMEEHCIRFVDDFTVEWLNKIVLMQLGNDDAFFAQVYSV